MSDEQEPEAWKGFEDFWESINTHDDKKLLAKMCWIRGWAEGITNEAEKAERRKVAVEKLAHYCDCSIEESQRDWFDAVLKEAQG